MTTPTPPLASFEAAAIYLATTGQSQPHQLKAFREAWARTSQAERELFSKAWRAAPAPPPAKPANPLRVPWYPQRDSASDQGRRMCFSSSCAMLLEFMKPGTLQGANGDDQYLARVRDYGDTTDPVAQIQALSSYCVRATFRRTATRADLQDSIDRGIPVPCGYLHRGPVSAPAGKGHYLIVIGYSQLGVWVNDPWADMNLVTGVEDGPARPRVLYSWENWLPRWQVEGEGSGWGVFARR